MTGVRAFAVLFLVFTVVSAAAEYRVQFITPEGNFVHPDFDSTDAVLVATGFVGPEDESTKFTLIDENGCALENGDTIFLKASNGLFVSAEPGGAAFANSNFAGDFERFTVEDVAGVGLRGGGTIRLKQASGGVLWVHEFGALFFMDDPPRNQDVVNLSNVDPPWPALSFTLTPFPLGPLSAGQILLQKATAVTGGPANATYKYTFSMTPVSGSTGADSGPAGTGSSWHHTPVAGRYRLNARVDGYCNGTFIGRATRSVPDYEVCGVNITAPAAGQVLTGGTATTIRWTRTASCSNHPMKVEYWSNGRKINDVATVNLNADSASWTVHPGPTAEGKIVLRNADAAKTYHRYGSGSFVIPGTPADAAVLDVTTHPALCAPSDNWIEVTVSSTAPRTVEATASVKNHVTGLVDSKNRTLNVPVGTSRYKFTMSFTTEDSRQITVTLPAGDVSRANDSKTIYLQSVRPCNP